MRINLEKDGKQFSYKAGYAWYLFTCLIAPIIGIGLSVIFKQFKGVGLNLIVVILGTNIAMQLLLMAGSNVTNYLAIAVFIIQMVVVIYLMSVYIVNANKYSIKAKLEDGYTVDKPSQEEKEFIESCKRISYPKIQLVSFNSRR